MPPSIPDGLDFLPKAPIVEGNEGKHLKTKMSERSTFELGYSAPERVNETVPIDHNVSHIDILLPQNREEWRDGFHWVNVVKKALRVSRIDERSLVLSDLSAFEGNHDTAPPVPHSEFDAPYDVMDIIPEEDYILGREHNPAGLTILRSELVSRRHLAITPHLGEAGLSLAFRDTASVNGSALRVYRTSPHTDSVYEALYA